MRSLLVSLLLLLSLAAHAQLPDPVLTVKERREVAEAFAKIIDTTYVLPEEAKKMVAAVRAKIASGAYDGLEPAQALVAQLVKDVRAVNNDRHLGLSIAKEIVPIETEEQREKRLRPKMIEDAKRSNYGIAKAEKLEGNIGYLDITHFPPADVAGPAADAAMAQLAGTDALIIDARRHRGGDPGMVAHVVSHFVPPGTLINTIYSRDKAEPQLFHAAKIAAKPYAKPVYVLTSRQTFSGGEELASDLQSMGRGKIYGEVTGGGAHPTGAFRIHERFVALIPSQRSVNPITKTNWEGIGVKPDVAVPAADALRAAHVAALQEIAGKTANAERKSELQLLAARMAPPSDANPRAALDAWIKSFNEHDQAAREQWLLANTMYPAEQAKKYAELDNQIRGHHGAFEIVKVRRTDALTIEVEAKHATTGAKARIEIALDAKQPAKIADVALEGLAP
ncbi:MAG TPA: S41 family peptidase [Thermoanaerobaculia bacterium]|nr:S41 family peptidase [Thermoanaerobaculia bacterium]